MKLDTEFIHESEVYKLVSSFNIKVPKFETNLENLTFDLNEPVVVKGIAQNIWHKSDEGALHFLNFRKEKVLELDKKMRSDLKTKYDYIETMVCERVNFKTIKGLPTEAFVSVQDDYFCGVVISFGIGGLFAEAWAKELKSSVLTWSPLVTSPEEALDEIKNHWIGKIWLGDLRLGEALTSLEQLKKYLSSLWKLSKNIQSKRIKLLEMNPVVIDEDGTPIALDGVGTIQSDITFERDFPSLSDKTLLLPQKIAIAGVSSRSGNFGARILTNLLNSKIKKENIQIIKPNTDLFMGVKCIQDIQDLINDPVDALILSLPANTTLDIIEQLCEQGAGAKIVYIVAGGIGDGADRIGLSDRLKNILKERRALNKWTPYIIGPNSLGIVNSPLNLNTLFIDDKKLPIHYYPNGNLAFISQSGAFFITRLSKESSLPIKYGFCIGNQIDLTVVDLINVISNDENIRVIGLYVEGFNREEVLLLSQLSKSLIGKNIRLVIYKAGHSDEGMRAASGHTGALYGNFILQQSILKSSNIIISSCLKQFSLMLNLLSYYPDIKPSKNIAVISNAGFETVASADLSGKQLLKMNDTLRIDLDSIFKKYQLQDLLSASNPLDLTPMAGEEMYSDCLEVFAKSEAEIIIVSIVPLTDKIDTINLSKVEEFASKIKSISMTYNKSILVVIDSGQSYNLYRDVFRKVKLPVLDSVEDAFGGLIN